MAKKYTTFSVPYELALRLDEYVARRALKEGRRLTLAQVTAELLEAGLAAALTKLESDKVYRTE